jgi:hypothetical protein
MHNVKTPCQPFSEGKRVFLSGYPIRATLAHSIPAHAAATSSASMAPRGDSFAARREAFRRIDHPLSTRQHQTFATSMRSMRLMRSTRGGQLKSAPCSMYHSPE